MREEFGSEGPRCSLKLSDMADGGLVPAML